MLARVGISQRIMCAFSKVLHSNIFAFYFGPPMSQGLGSRYVQHALEIACSAINGTVKAGSQFELSLEFLGIVHDVNSIVYLLLKHFWDRVLPLVRSSVNVGTL